ncbi:MAG: quinone oxidoreductase [Alphaproteobacteria bacterium]|nr:quinone oxidoreductase [Alphaproteobacteria bacterium]
MTTAIRLSRTGGPEVLELKPIDLPPPPEGFARVRHTAIGVNFIDIYHRSGLYPVPLPSGLGLEAAGIIEALGPNVRGLTVGDRIGYCTGPLGAYATEANVPASRMVKLPKGIGDDVAAASLLKGMTAQYLLKRTYPVRPGDTILFHAAAGGVGQIAVQWAKALGATVIGTAGSEEKMRLARTLGCDHVINSRTEDIAARVREITGGEGVPVVYDSVGKDTFTVSLDCLKPRGLMVSFGNASGPVPPFEPGILNAKGSLYLTRPSLFHYTATTNDLQATADDLFAALFLEKVILTPPMIFPLAKAGSAHSALESRQTTGSLILVP